MTSNYGGRNGMSSIIFFVRQTCRIYTKFSAGIIAFINASSLSSGDKATVIAWLNAASAACAILETLKVTYPA